ncbi:MAG TPA: FAD-dependent thymidylate synthase [Candidatus Binatia bacterium]|nr:FAD-dependent thymidylate synthase [Candidatus Binatia bacterium]
MSSGYKPAAGNDGVSPAGEPSTEVYAVHGADPEVQAYGMAKYSRSALSMRQSLAEINGQKAEKFLNTFYFQYGHRSIADLAHIAFAIERLSILAATVVVDEPRWDGQERSTRYQNFQKSGYHVPDFGADDDARRLFRETVEHLFAEYRHFSEEMFRYLRERTPKPLEMKEEAYERTLRARAFDISRYLLPLATNTSLGQIVSARTLENQVSRLLSNSHAEVRRLGELLKRAAQEPAYIVGDADIRELLQQIGHESPAAAERASEFLLHPVRVAPTLMKYAEPNAYGIETRRELTSAAAALLGPIAVEDVTAVQLLEDDPLEIELAATLLYQYSHHPYRQIREVVGALPQAQRREIIDMGLRHRGRFDEVARAFSAGQQFRFDILMDIGGFRDLHRHRRCVQIVQDYTAAHGYDVPLEIDSAGLTLRYDAAMERARDIAAQLAARHAEEAEEQSQYVIPLAFRKRTLFKMDLAEAIYISELRTGAAGHFSYRNIAWVMYEAVAQRYPALAKYFRVTDVREPVDILKR